MIGYVEDHPVWWPTLSDTQGQTYDLLTISGPLIVNVPLIVICLYTLNSSSNHIVFFLDFSFMPCASIYDFTSICFKLRNDLGGWEYAKHYNIHSHDQILKSSYLFCLKKIQEYQGHLEMLYANFWRDPPTCGQCRRQGVKKCYSVLQSDDHLKFISSSTRNTVKTVL